MLASELLKRISASAPPSLGSSLVLANYPLVSAPINLAAAGPTVVVPPSAGFKLLKSIAAFMLIEKDGTITTAPTLKIGTNATFDDVCASQTVAAFTTQASNTAVTIAGLSPAPANLDLTSNGLVLSITSPAVLGTATFFRGRLFLPNTGVFAY